MADSTPTSTTDKNKWLVTITVMLVAVVEVLDMSIVNVSLPNMMGTLSASTEQITWVLTAYILSAAILMPLTGFLSTRFGQKKLLLSNIIGFCIASVLCGLATSLPEIVIYRAMQGAFGAALVPLSQSILRQVFPKEQHGQAMAIWGIGIMAGPVLGPTLGGYITDALSWPWVFYINLPICILAFFMALSLIDETPTKHVKLDVWGLTLMAIGVGALQIFLDQGNSKDWFQSDQIMLLCATWVFFLSVYIYRCSYHDNNIINVHLFLNKNFAICSILITVFGLSVFGSMAIAPIMLEQLFDYPAKTAGLMMAPQAIASAVGMLVVSRIIMHVDARKIIGIGLCLTATGAYLRSGLNLNMSAWQFIGPGILQGFGTGLFFVPLTTLAFSTLKQADETEAAGLFSFCRSIGSSIGISIATTILTRQTTINWQQLSENINRFNPNFQQWLAKQQLTLDNPHAMQIAAKQVSTHASMIAFVDTFFMISVVTILLLPALLLIDARQSKL